MYDKARATGRTSAIALAFIAECMQRPLEPIPVPCDHYVWAGRSREAVLHMTQHLIHKLGYVGFTINRQALTMMFHPSEVQEHVYARD